MKLTEIHNVKYITWATRGWEHHTKWQVYFSVSHLKHIIRYIIWVTFEHLVIQMGVTVNMHKWVGQKHGLEKIDRSLPLARTCVNRRDISLLITLLVIPAGGLSDDNDQLNNVTPLQSNYLFSNSIIFHTMYSHFYQTYESSSALSLRFKYESTCAFSSR